MCKLWRIIKEKIKIKRKEKSGDKISLLMDVKRQYQKGGEEEEEEVWATAWPNSYLIKEFEI